MAFVTPVVEQEVAQWVHCTMSECSDHRARCGSPDPKGEDLEG